MNFKTIQRLKNYQVLNTGNINMAKVMAARLYSKGFLDFIKTLLLSLLFESNFIYKDSKSDFIISKNFDSDKRKDYDFIYKKLKDTLIDFNEIIFIKRFKPFYLLLNIKNTIIYYKKNKSTDILFSERVKISLLENYFNNLLIKLHSFSFNSKVYISFCDSYLEENLAAQFFNYNGTLTATLQHGQYRLNNKGYESTDSESYLNLVSDYIFVWGIKTKHEFLKAGVNPEKIIVTGALKPFTQNNKIINHKTIKSFIVFLNGESHVESNYKMILLANEFAELYDFTYVIRPHPMNPLKKYLKKTNYKFNGLVYKEDQTFNNDFAIVHSSGIFLELMSKNFPFFHLLDDYLDSIFRNDYNNFSNITELKCLYESLVLDHSTFIEEMTKDYKLFNIASNFSELDLRYKSAIKSITNKIK